MSPANVKYVCANHPFIAYKVEENPNSVDLGLLNKLEIDRLSVLEKWAIPTDKVIFLYGGNLGKPQGTIFLLSLIAEAKNLPNAYFLIVGDGTDYPILKEWFNQNEPGNAKIIKRLPKSAFYELAACCDVGMILLRREFTIPNFPSRLLTYMENKMPVLAITDEVSDVGSLAESEGFGKWCLYGELDAAIHQISFFTDNAEIRTQMGLKGFSYMKKHYDVKLSCAKILELFTE
jgi:glycosyltransferase involved in cell wall biosynthesis